MSAASDIVSKGKVPDEWADAAAEMEVQVQEAYAHLADLGENPQIPAIRFARDEATGEVINDANGNPEMIALVDENNNPVMEAHPLHARNEKDGLFAYRYEPVGDDGSVVALYVHGEGGKVQMLAFDTLEEASAWSPREL